MHGKDCTRTRRYRSLNQGRVDIIRLRVGFDRYRLCTEMTYSQPRRNVCVRRNDNLVTRADSHCT